jgi:hypothetical protein
MSRKKRSIRFSHDALVSAEVHGKARVAGQPPRHLGVAVRGVVVHDQVQAWVLGRTAVDWSAAMTKTSHCGSFRLDDTIFERVR